MRPQVYVSVSGGVSYEFKSGDVELITVDWDNYKEGGLDHYELEDLLRKRAELSRVRDERARGEALTSIDEVIAEYKEEYGDDQGLCKYESAEPGTLLCTKEVNHDGDHDTPSYAKA